MKNKRHLIIGLVVIAIIFLFSIKIYNDKREKGLDDVISYNIASFESLIFNDGEGQFGWKTDKVEHAEKLNDFLSRYRVKRMKHSEWDTDVSKEEGFRFIIYSNGKPIIAHIFEQRLLFANDGYGYKVVNGPIDIAWMKDYIEEFKE